MAENPFESVGGAALDQIFSGVMWLAVALFAVIAIGGVMWYWFGYKRKFDIMVKIRSERAGEPSIVSGVGAIFHDRKTNSKYFKIIAGQIKVELPVPPFTIMQKDNRGRDVLELWRKSEDEFHYLTPGVIDSTEMVRQDGKVFPLSTVKQKTVEGDIAYWNVKRKRDYKGIFNQETIWMKMLPWIPQMVGGIFIIFVIWILADKMPNLINELTTLTRELRTLKGTQTYDFILPWLTK